MLRNYFKTAWRNLYKNKLFSLIHILGLTIGITVCIMIFLYILNEFSVDRFHKQQKNIYRVMRGYDATKDRVAYLSGPYGPALANDFPNDIKQVVRVLTSTGLIAFKEKSFAEKKLYYADPGFFTMFSFPFIKGNPATALNDPGNVVLSETTAQKYFGNEDPMGKVLQVDKNMQFKVTGVIKDVPSNSHLNFDLVLPLAVFYKAQWFNTWINNSMFTYVLIDNAASKKRVERGFPAFVDKYMGKNLARMRAHFDLALTPLKDIYFEHPSSFDNVRHGDKKIVYIFLSVAVLIMLIACINFLNLSTIRAAERSKEVGMRKVLGALRQQLIFQFISESILLALISCILSIVLLWLMMPWYNSILGYSLTVKWTSLPIYLFIAGLILVIGFLAGSYPAFFISNFSPIQALKGKLRFGKNATFFRQMLVVIQFSISVLLIIGTVVIMSQMKYIKNKSLGYDQDQTIAIRIDNNDIYDHRLAFKNELIGKAGIEAVSLMSGEPGGFFDVHQFNAEGQTEVFKSRTEFADVDYVKTLGLKIIAGRDLSLQFATDSADAVLINRTAATKLGFTPEQAVGKWIKNTTRDSTRRNIVGVVEDFNFLSLKESMDALVISPSDDRRVILVKIKAGNINNALATVKHAYNEVAPVYPFEYTFLNQQFDNIYKTDVRQQTILSIFSGLAIFIACLGLFGLASFSAAKRTKEIGVRKVLGSSVPNILVLMSKEILKPVVIATIIAIPLGYYSMDKWLQNFAYRINLHWWLFAIAAFVTFFIALATISYNALKAALANPVKSLRSE